MLRQNPDSKKYSADIKHRTFGRIHLGMNTKVRDIAMTRHSALEQLLNCGEPVRDIVDALRARKINIEAVAECVRSKRSFDVLRPSVWPTLAEAAEELKEAQLSRENGAANTARGTDGALRQAIEFFGGDTRVESISFEQVSAYKNWLREKELASNTIKLYMIKLGAVYTYLQRRETRKAMQAKRVPAVLFSPLDREEHVPATVKTRKRFLVEPEAERLLTVTPNAYKLAVALGIFAGLRIGEVCMLRAGVDVDVQLGVIFVQAREGWKPKYGIDRSIPISSALEPFVLQHMQQMASFSGYLFPDVTGESFASRAVISHVFKRVTADAELSGSRFDPNAVTFHTLRHTFASWLVMSGADLLTIARLMGHTTTKQLEETYAHLSPGHRLATVEMLSARWQNRPVSTSAERAAHTNRDTQNA